MTRWVSTDTDHLEKYHTDMDCQYFPQDYREMTEADERRHLIQCSECRDERLSTQLLRAGAD